MSERLSGDVIPFVGDGVVGLISVIGRMCSTGCQGRCGPGDALSDFAASNFAADINKRASSCTKKN